MTLPRTLSLTLATLLLALAAIAGPTLLAHERHDHGDTGENATPAATPGDENASTGTGVVYLTITNEGDADDTLLGVETDRAERVELHETEIEDAIARMTPLGDELSIPAGETVTFEPGGRHMMLVNLTDDIRPGDEFDVTLTFEVAGDVTVPVTAVFDPELAEGDPVPAGDITIAGAWSRPAPRIDGAPAGTPASMAVGTPTVDDDDDDDHDH